MRVRNYKEADMSLTGRNHLSRKVGNNTYLQRRMDGRPGDPIAVKLHVTDVVTYYADGRITIKTGGWQSVTTKARINEFTPDGYYLYQKKGDWFLSKPNGDVIAFEDGMDLETSEFRIACAEALTYARA